MKQIEQHSSALVRGLKGINVNRWGNAHIETRTSDKLELA